MKQIACIHTVYGVIESFIQQMREGIPGDFLIHTLYDDFLATDAAPGRAGKFTAINHQRLRLDLQAQVLTGADVIVVTCSTLSPSVRLLRGEFNVPIVAIDDAMMEEAVSRGTRIGLLATAQSTVKASASTLYAAAQACGKEIDLQIICDEKAILALKAGDKETHDRMVLEMAGQFRERDVIVLAQASTAYMEQAVAEVTGIPTLSSPSRCIERIHALL